MLRVIRGPGLPECRENLIAQCADLIREGNGDDFLWVTPTHRSALALSASLLRRSGVPAAPEPRVLHLAGLFERCTEVPRAVSGRLLQAAITEIIDSHPQAWPAFVNGRGQVRGGAVALLAQVFVDLRARGSAFPSPRSDAERQALEILGRLSEHLGASDVIDEGARRRLMRWALTPEALADRFGSAQFAVLDGFDELDEDFSRALGALRDWVEDDVELLIDDPIDRPALRAHLADALDEILAEVPEEGRIGVESPPMSPLVSSFGNEGFPKEPIDDPSVELILCRTPHDEAVWFARRIKRWVREHPDVPLSRIAVTFANLEEVAPVVSDVFRTWGIPFNLSGPDGGGETLASTPLIQTAMALWRVAASDFARRDLAALARHRLWRGTYGLHALDFEIEGPELRVASGLALWRQRIGDALGVTKRLLGEPGDLAADEESRTVRARRERAARLERMEEALARIAADLEPLRGRTTVSGALSALREILVRRHALDRLLILAGMGESPDAVTWHLRAFGALEDLIDELGRARWLAERALEPPEALRQATMLLEQTPMETRPPDTEAVQVLGRYELRGLPWSLICVGGLVEGKWPPEQRIPPFGEDSPLALKLHPEEVHLARQRHAFYQILRTGAECLVLSRPALIGDIPQNPSPLLEEVAMRLGRLGDIFAPGDRGAPADAKPPWKVEDITEPSDCLTGRELQAVAGGVLDASLPGVPLASLDRCLREGGEPLDPMRRGIAGIHARRQIEPWSAWDGQVTDAGLLGWLADHAADRIWSATQLESFSQCAWRASAERLLGLEAPRDDPDAGIQPMERGLLIHAILCDFLRGWRARKRRERAFILPEEVGEAWGLMREVAGTHLERRPQGALLWEIERELLLGTGERPGTLMQFVDDEASAGTALAPTSLEWAFGWPEGREPPGSEGHAPPLEISTTGGASISLRGVIDRIESSEANEWAVVDYKTGAVPLRTDIARGLHLQIPLYMRAVQRLLAGGSGRVVQGAVRRVGRLDQMETRRIL
ncbi:exodeoxyribonuclease V subunit gamma, partial [Candidatus Sumerlaeota bacterium]|nr:exodeoxyribonuclease V subunit gamma [Candidatus Sumerlaeota bacterium]